MIELEARYLDAVREASSAETSTRASSMRSNWNSPPCRRISPR